MANKTESLYEMFPIGNIKKGYIEYENKAITKFYKIKTDFDTDWINEYKLNQHINNIVKVISEINTKYVLTFTIIGNNESNKVENLIESKKNDNQFINDYLDDKKEFQKKFKKLTYVLGISSYDNKIDDSFLKNILKNYSVMDEYEIFNFLFNIMNPDKYNDNIETPKYIKQLRDSSISLNKILLQSYIEEGEKNLIIGDTSVSQYIMTTPPPINENYMTGNMLIDSLSNLKSSFIVTMMFRNDPSIFSSLNKKKMFAEGGLLSWLSSLNNSISSNISIFKDQVMENNYSTSRAAIYFSIYNVDDKELIEDKRRLKKIEGLEGSIVIKNNYSKLSDYLGHIPGYYLSYRYNFILSAKEVATLMLFPKVNYDDISFFTKKSKVLSNFSFDAPNVANPSGIVFAPPRRGKSALLNYVYLNYFIKHQDNLRSLIIDFGGSYAPIYNLLNDDSFTYTTLEIGEDTHYNPFDLELGKEINIDIINRKIPILLNFFYEALSMDDSEETLLSIGLEEMYNQYLLNSQGKPKIDRELRKPYLEIYNESEYTDKNAFFKSMPTINNFVSVISGSIKIKNSYDSHQIDSFVNKINSFMQSKRGKIFSSTSTDYFLNKNLIVDLQRIAETDEKLLNLVLVYLIQSKLLEYSNHDNFDKVKLIMIDEFDQFNKRSQFIGPIVKTIFKTGAKQNIHQYLISQNATDFDNQMFNLCSHLIAFNPNTMEEINQLHNITGYPMEELNILMDKVRSKLGEYSEFAVFTNNELKERTLLRFRTSPFEYYSFITTSPNERSQRNSLIQKHNGNYKAAIEEMIKLNS